MDFSSYKAFLFDVDKTITNSKKEITPRTKTAIQNLVQKKYAVGICTGRHFATVHGTLQNYFPEDSLHVLAGGGLLTDGKGTVLFQNVIPDSVVRTIAHIASEHDCRLVIQSGSQLYGNEKARQYQSAYVLESSQQKKMEDAMTLADWSVPLVVVGGVTDAALQALSGLPISFKSMVNYTGERYVDITNVGVTKANGVKEWCRIQGIQPELVVGFGDGENDIEFLQTVGYSIAMGNAVEAVKAIANEVVSDCDHDGVAEWIERNI